MTRAAILFGDITRVEYAEQGDTYKINIILKDGSIKDATKPILVEKDGAQFYLKIPNPAHHLYDISYIEAAAATLVRYLLQERNNIVVPHYQIIYLHWTDKLLPCCLIQSIKNFLPFSYSEEEADANANDSGDGFTMNAASLSPLAKLRNQCALLYRADFAAALAAQFIVGNDDMHAGNFGIVANPNKLIEFALDPLVLIDFDRVMLQFLLDHDVLCGEWKEDFENENMQGSITCFKSGNYKQEQFPDITLKNAAGLEGYDLALMSEFPEILEKNKLYVRKNGENIQYKTHGMTEFAVITPFEFPEEIAPDFIDLDAAKISILTITSKRGHTRLEKNPQNWVTTFCHNFLSMLEKNGYKNNFQIAAKEIFQCFSKLTVAEIKRIVYSTPGMELTELNEKLLNALSDTLTARVEEFKTILANSQPLTPLHSGKNPSPLSGSFFLPHGTTSSTPSSPCYDEKTGISPLNDPGNATVVATPPRLGGSPHAWKPRSKRSAVPAVNVTVENSQAESCLKS